MASEDRVLGRIGTTLKGEYDNNKTYTKLNQVTFKGGSYTLKVAEAKGVLPTNTDYWVCSAQKGDKGEKGDKGDTGPIGPKPVNGVDYNTNAEREEFKNAVVADSKADLEKYITEKETHLDNYTKEKETKLDDYVTDTVKPTIDIYVTDTTKKDIDKYEKEKEKVLDTYIDTKKTEIDNYVTNTSKPALDQYEKDKEAELETAKNTAIVEYDAHAESVLTETNDLFNALDTEKASGTKLYIEDAKPCRVMSTEIDGMYEQETTTGKQLFNPILDTTTKKGITLTKNIDGTYTANGTANEVAFFVIGAFNFIANTNYILNGCPQNGSISTYQIILVDTANAYDVGNGYNCVFTEDTTKNVVIRVQKGVTVNNIVFKPMISLVGGEFEKYTGGIASPNSNYPQEIGQVESVKLEICNQNLFDGEFRQGGIDSLNNLTRCFSKNNIYIETGNYLVITDLDVSVYNYGILVSDTKFPTTVQNFSYDSNWKKKGKFVFSITKSGNLGINLRKNDNSNITLNMINDIKFAIFKLNPINIDLKGNKLCAISDTIKDKLLIDRNGNVALQKNVSLITLKKDNIVSRTALSNGDILYRTTQSIINSNKIFVLCNYYIGIPNISSRADGTIYCNTSNLNSIDIIDNSASITTVDEYKTFVENNQIEVYYTLATPEIIDLGQLTELPKTFEGINNIWAETNLGNTEIEIEYVQDVKKLLEKQAEQQNARLDNIEALLSTTQTSALLLDNMQNDLENEVK